jgi:dipeptidyl-peptidase-4
VFPVALAVATSSIAAGAQELSVDLIFGGQQLAPEGLPEMTWTPDGRKMTFVVPRDGQTTDLVALNLDTGQQERVVDGSTLIPPGELNPVPIEGYQWSPDGRSLLIYTRSERVWRDNTRGVYFVYSLRDATLRPISTGFGYQMFAKFSPGGDRVGFVRDHNLFVTNLVDGTETQLTHDGSEEIINGTFDWVYEEELGLQDGWRWSPDGRSIAFWRLDQTPIKDFHLIDDLGLYSRPIPIPYPKAGEPNSFAHIGVVEVASGETRWMDFGENPDQYLARMEWARSSDELIVQRLNRHQNRLDVMLADRTTGSSRVLFTESSDTWVDVDDDLRWVDDERFLWTSDRDGYDHVYLYDRDGGLVRQLTSGEFDVE